MNRSKGELEYCYLCYEWFTYETWNEHCETHLQDNSWSRCGVLEREGTTLRPAFCPFCIGNKELDGERRMHSWGRDRAMKKHLEAHVSGTKWPRECPVPCCKSDISGRESFLHHLKNNHALDISSAPSPETSKTSIITHDPVKPKRKEKRKRDVTDCPVSVDIASPSGRALSTNHSTLPFTISPMLLGLGSDVDTKFDCPPIPNDQILDEAFMKPDEDFQSSLDAPTSIDDSELFSKFIRSPSPEAEDETANKENTDCSKTNCDNPSDDLGDLRPKKRLRIILRVRPPNSDQTEPKSQANDAGRDQRQRKGVSRKVKKSKNLPKSKPRLKVRSATK